MVTFFKLQSWAFVNEPPIRSSSNFAPLNLKKQKSWCRENRSRQTNLMQRAFDCAIAKVASGKIENGRPSPQAILHRVPEFVAMRSRQYYISELLRRRVHELVEADLIEELDLRMLFLNLRDRGWAACRRHPAPRPDKLRSWSSRLRRHSRLPRQRAPSWRRDRVCRTRTCRRTRPSCSPVSLPWSRLLVLGHDDLPAPANLQKSARLVAKPLRQFARLGISTMYRRRGFSSI